MTTHQLVRECAKQEVTVTVTQLTRWVRAGLIPGSLRYRHGRGQGKGTEWLWNAECLPRALIIGRSLTHDRSLLHAAKALAEIGYAPSPPVLRQVLLDCITLYQHPMTVRQTYIGSHLSKSEQYKRFKRHIRQKLPAMPDAIFDLFLAYSAALLGVLPDEVSSVPEFMKQIQRNLSVVSLQERIGTMEGSLLLTKYEDAGRMIPGFLPPIVGLLNEVLLPLAQQLQEKQGQDVTSPLASIDLQAVQHYVWREGEHILTSNRAIGGLRLYLVIFLAALPSDSAMLSQWVIVLSRLVRDVWEHFGVFPPMLTDLFGASNTNMSDL